MIKPWDLEADAKTSDELDSMWGDVSLNELLFHVADTPDGPCACIVPKEFFIKNKCMYYEHLPYDLIEDVPELASFGFEQMMESMFMFDGDIGDVRKTLLQLGLEENDEFSTMVG